ncbi:hypothetical protein [Clostridium sp.]|uniref:ComEA family DNA-binding protein n=1 Tax=Clostridium sp. TaxID=1506 RepID=UPI002FC5D1F5
MRIHAIKNNRFIYHTAYPYEEDFKDYNHLHMAHITSSAFTPEKVKNGAQMMCSEGVIASIFYGIYKSEVFKLTYVEKSFYEKFKASKDIHPVTNLYLKVLYTLTNINLNVPNPMINFIVEYGSLFPSEREELIKLFLAATHFATVNHEAPNIFGNLYRIGRQGEMEKFKAYLSKVRRKKEHWITQVLSKEIPLDFAIYKDIWIETDSKITPVPWNPNHLVKYKIDINTATEIDFMSIEGISLEQAKDIVIRRERLKGFSSKDLT